MKIIADIGATRGRWVLLNGKNTNIIKTEGFNPYVSEINLFDTILRSLESKIDTTNVSKIIYYGAGINNEELKKIIEENINNYFKKAQIEVYSDLIGSCRALCGKNEGVVSILGTGSNSCFFNGKKIVKKINSLGYLLGDEGSGYVLGRSFLKKYFRNELPDNISDSFKNNYNADDSYLSKVYNGDSHKLISRVSKFIYSKKEEECIKKLIIDHFNHYFNEIILKYNSKNIYLSGSVAHYFSNEIKEVSNKNKVNIISIIKDPIDHLVKYHVL